MAGKKYLKKNPKEKLYHYAFWSWEYQRRNQHYIDAWKDWSTKLLLAESDVICLVDTIIQSEVLCDVKEDYEIFLEKYHRPPKDPAIGLSSDQMIEKLLAGHDKCAIDSFDDIAILLKCYPRSVRVVGSEWCTSIDNDGRPYFDNKPDDHGKTNLSKSLTLKIDMEYPIEQINLEIAFHFYERKTPSSLYGCFKKDSASCSVYEQKGIDAAIGLFEYLRKIKLSGMNVVDDARAVGLWIFDHIRSVESASYSFASVCEAFYEKFGDETVCNKFGNQYENASRLKEFYENAKLCVEKMDLLPFSK